MNVAKVLYHRLIPASVRNPFGLWRRDVMRRLSGRERIPPAAILERIQSTATAAEYREVGQRAAQSVIRVMGSSLSRTPRLLDLGCGPARVLRHLPSSWDRVGADEFEDAVDWSRRNVPKARFVQVDLGSQLPFEDQSFSALIVISLLSGLEPARRANVVLEAARVLGPGGLLIASTPGLAVLGAFDPNASLEEVRRKGVFRSSTGPYVFTPRGLDQLLAAHFEPLLWEERGLDGFQDLFAYRRRG